METTLQQQLTPRDFASDQDVRWCPGCGDYAILAQVKKILPTLGIPRENFVFVSGIGCSSRFPYYLETYGFHGIHGRAPTIATGIKCANPELSVWVVTGDGDALSIGGNHILHVLRRNVDITILLFNNRIYGLTKGQYSPTSEHGKRTSSSPSGSVDYPLYPVSLALGAEGTFVARSIDVRVRHLADTIRQASEHRGTSFVEIYQDCNIFNAGAWKYATDKDEKDDNTIELKHGEPLVFAKGKKGIRMVGMNPEVVELGGSITEDDLLVHDESSPASAFMLSRMRRPEFPEPIGVFYRVERPTYDAMMEEQIREATANGVGTLEDLFAKGSAVWTVEEIPGAAAAEPEPEPETSWWQSVKRWRPW